MSTGDVVRAVSPVRYAALALSGGGTKGFAMLGAVHALREAGALEGCQVYAGTSVGALIAALLATGADLRLVMDRLLTQACEYEVDLDNLTAHYSLDDGAGLRAMIESHIDPRLTFADLSATLVVCAACVNTKSAVYFSKATHPDMAVALALRMSCSIPLVFACVPWEGRLYVDGMLVDSLPVQAAAGVLTTVGAPTLAVELCGPDSTDVPDFETYLLSLFATCLNRPPPLPEGCGLLRLHVPDRHGLDLQMDPVHARQLWALGTREALAMVNQSSTES